MKTSNKFLIYIVDDDELFLESLKYTLESKWPNAIETKLFHTGEELLKYLEQELPDIIILDYILNTNIPLAMDGSMVLQKLKQLHPEIKVIMLSGQSKIQVALDSIQNGAFDYVIKNDNVFLKIKSTIKKAILTVSDADRTKKMFLTLTVIILFAGLTITSVMLAKVFFF